jgi:serine/threonine-protein kinase
MNTDTRLAEEREARLQGALTDCLEAADSGRAADLCAVLGQHREFADEMAELLGARARVEELAAPLRKLTEEDTTEYRGGGEELFGDYELREVLGRGGMGVVYKAWQKSLRRFVALKRIRAGQLASEDDVRRFRAEAEKVARLKHPNIVPLLEYGEQQGRHYFTMKFLEGGSLSERIKQGPVASRQAARWLLEVTRAIEAAHRAGIIHRDLKPENVVLDDEERAHVADFGLAKQVEGGSNLTQSGAILGTPGYMAPEQAAGEGKRVGPAADIYGLGAILYTLLTGRPPFQSETVLDTLDQVLHHEPAAPHLLNPRVNRDLERICLKCLQKGPNRRYASAAELAEDLEDYLAGVPLRHARAPGWLDGLLRPVGHLLEVELRRQWGRACLVSAALTLAGCGAVFVLLQTGQPLGWVWLTLGLPWALWALGLWALLIRRGRSEHPIERHVTAIWVGFLLGFPFLFLAYGVSRASDVLAAYPALAVLTGFSTFVQYWGRLYLVALAYFVLAVGMRFWPEGAPLEYGLFHGGVLLGYRWHLSARHVRTEPAKPVAARQAAEAP